MEEPGAKRTRFAEEPTSDAANFAAGMIGFRAAAAASAKPAPILRGAAARSSAARAAAAGAARATRGGAKPRGRGGATTSPAVVTATNNVSLSWGCVSDVS